MKILLATDGSTESKNGAKLLANLGWGHVEELTLVTVSHDPSQMATSYVPVAQDWRKQQDERVAKNHEEIAELFGDKMKVRRVHRIGNESREILSVAEETSADLIVMGAVGHSMISRMLLGSVSDYVANHAKCSVMIVRPQSEMTEIKNVLLAFDGSLAATAAVDEFLSFEWTSVPKVIVSTIVQQYDYLLGDGLNAAALSGEQEWFERMRGENKTMTEKIAETIPNSVPSVTRGYHVGDTLVGLAEEHAAQLIVVGDAGHNAVEDLFLGSTTKYVMRHADCSVLISRKSAKVSDSCS